MDATGTFDAAQVLGARSVFNAPTVPRQITQNRAEIQAKAQAAYDAGAPLFSKDDFRRVVEVFDRAMLDSGLREHRLAVRGMDGVRVRFVLKLGGSASIQVPGKDTTLKFLLKDVHIKYHSIETITGRTSSSSSTTITTSSDPEPALAIAALPFSLVHTGAMVSKATGAAMAGLPVPWHWRDPSVVVSRLGLAEAWWQLSETCARVDAIFSGRVPVVDGSVPLGVVCLPAVIDKVVAFGCGSIAAAADGGSEHTERAGARHALVLSVRDALAARADCRRLNGWAAPEEIWCYAQDAGYQPADRVGLAEAGITVLDDPRALLEVDRASVVVSFTPDFPLRQIIADIARPAALIWPRVTDADTADCVSRCDPVSPRVRRMIQDYYVEVECPFDEPEWKGCDPVVYMRKTLPWTLWGGFTNEYDTINV